jgi:hypothetical protein
MNWARAIEINKAALTRIVAALVAMLAVHAGLKRLPLPVHQAIARVLYPAESAVRRLILIAAKNLVVSQPPPSPMSDGLVIAGNGTGPMAFRLFDSRKHFDDEESVEANISGPRIRVIGDLDPRSQFLAQFTTPPDGLTSEAETLRLTRRLAAVNRALENLTREAKRMARWRMRRLALKSPKFLTPLRPGPPPGARQRGTDEIDHVLRECHGLAWDALQPDTS